MGRLCSFGRRGVILSIVLVCLFIPLFFVDHGGKETEELDHHRHENQHQDQNVFVFGLGHFDNFLGSTAHQKARTANLFVQDSVRNRNGTGIEEENPTKSKEQTKVTDQLKFKSEERGKKSVVSKLKTAPVKNEEFSKLDGLHHSNILNERIQTVPEAYIEQTMSFDKVLEPLQQNVMKAHEKDEDQESQGREEKTRVKRSDQPIPIMPTYMNLVIQGGGDQSSSPAKGTGSSQQSKQSSTSKQQPKQSSTSKQQPKQSSTSKQQPKQSSTFSDSKNWNLEPFYAKHKGSSFPTDMNNGNALYKTMRNALGEIMYTRFHQSVIFPSNPGEFETALRNGAAKGLDSVKTLELVPWKTQNPDYWEATEGIKNSNYEKALEFLKKTGDRSKTVVYLKEQSEEAVKKLLQDELTKVQFEPSESKPIVIPLSKEDRIIQIERVGDDPTGRSVSKSDKAPADFQGWKMGELKQREEKKPKSVKVSPYLEVELSTVTDLTDRTKLINSQVIDLNTDTPGKWNIHYNGHDDASKPTFGQVTKPAFAELDELNMQRRSLKKQFNQLNAAIKASTGNPPQDIKVFIKQLKKKLEKPNIKAKIQRNIEKQIKSFEKLQKMDSNTLKLRQDLLDVENKQFAIEKELLTSLSDNDPDYKKKFDTILTDDQIKQKFENSKLKSKTTGELYIETKQNLLTAKQAQLRAETEYFIKAGTLQGAGLDNPRNAVLETTKTSAKAVYTFKQIENEVAPHEHVVKAAIKSACSSGGGTRRKRATCSCCAKKAQKVEMKSEKLERKAKKLDKIKNLMKKLFSSKKTKKSPKISAPDQQQVHPKVNPELDNVVKSKNLGARFKGSAFVQEFLGVRNAREAYVGRKAVQKALAVNKKGFQAGAGKLAGAIGYANYAFLARDFTRACVQGDVTTAVTMLGMTGAQLASTASETVAVKGKLLGMTLDAGKRTTTGLLVTSRLVGGGLTVAGIVFDIKSIVNSGKCLGQNSDNTAMCIIGDPKCKTENEVCEGRDHVFDIVRNSLSIVGTVASLAFPPAAPFIAVFSFVLMIFGEVYQAHKYLDNFEKDIPLYADERWWELGKKLTGQHVSDHLEQLKDQKKKNTLRLIEMREFLEQNSELFWAFFGPALDTDEIAYLDNTVKVRVEDYNYKSFSRWSPDPNRKVECAKLYEIEDFNFFCRPRGESPESDFSRGYSYHCQNTMGVRIETQKSAKELFAYFSLERGTDTIFGFENVPNYFDVQSGYKDFSGGQQDDIFDVNDEFRGALKGNAGRNSITLSENLNSSSIVITNKVERGDEQLIQMGSNFATLKDMHNIQGRAKGREIIHALCSTQSIDGAGGQDEIYIDEGLKCSPSSPINLRITMRPGLTVKNQYQGEQGAFFYDVVSTLSPPSSSSSHQITLQLDTKSTSVQNFISLSQISAVDIHSLIVQFNKRSWMLYLEQVIHISSLPENVPEIMTKDRAFLKFVPHGPDSDDPSGFQPIFFFDLAHGYQGDRIIRGNQVYSNHFKLVGGNYNKIVGGDSDDRFILGADFQCNEIWSGNGGFKSIEMLPVEGHQRSNLKSSTFELDFEKKVITFPNNSTCKLKGDSFRHVYGQNGQIVTKKVTVSPSILSVDLKTDGVGTFSSFSNDIIIIPRNENNNNSTQYKLTIALNSNIRVFSQGQHGSTTYHFRKDAGHSEVTLQNPSTTYSNIFALDFLAQDLKIMKDTSKSFTILDLSSTKNRLKLNMNPAEFSEFLQILTKEQAQISFFSHGNEDEFDAAFKFTLTESFENDVIIHGGKFNPNFFILSGIYKAVHGGQKSDTFIIGPDSQVELIDGGNLEDDTLQFDESVSEHMTIDFSSGFFSRTKANNIRLKTELKGNFHHIQGRSSASEILITNPRLKTVNLQGTQNSNANSPGEIDFILIPQYSNPKPGENYDILIEYQNSSQLLLFNGATDGKFVYNVKTQTLSGEFHLFNVYNPYEDLENARKNKTENETTNSAVEFNAEESFHFSGLSFFDLASLEADPKSHTVKIELQAQAQFQFQENYKDDKEDDENEDNYYNTAKIVRKASFQIRHFRTYEKLLEEFERRVECENPNLNSSCSENSTSTPVPIEDPDEMLPLNPLIKFPTFTTSDDYEIVINHLGGIHAVTSIPLSTFSSQSSHPDLDFDVDRKIDEAEEIINQRVQIVNDLGISLIISLVDDLERMNLKEMIFMGGDDETDSLMNHPSLPSHLVGNAGGEQNFFVILATENQAPVYIYLPQGEIKQKVPCRNKWTFDDEDSNFDFDADFESTLICDENSPDPVPVNVLNLAGFFDRPLRPDEEQDVTEDSETIETDKTENEDDSDRDSQFKAPTENITKNQNSSSSSSQNQTENPPFEIRKPKILIPKINQEGESHLRITVKYLQDPYDYESSEMEQELVFVNGVEDHKKLSVRLYVATYRIEKDEYTNEWSLVPEKLILSRRDKRHATTTTTTTPENSEEDSSSSEPEMEPTPEVDLDLDMFGFSTKIKHVFLSHADLFEYLDFGIPIQLDENTKALDGPKSFYTNGESLIITNKVDVNPSLKFDDVWGSTDDDSAITIVLLDIKKSMEKENFTVTIKAPNPVDELIDSNLNSDSDADSNFPALSQNAIPDFVISFDSIDQLPDYKEAVEEMEKKKVWNHKLALGIIILLLVLLLLLTVYLVLFILRNFGRGKREKTKRKTRDTVNFEHHHSHEQEKERFLTDQSRTTYHMMTLAEQKIELKSLLLPLQHQHQQQGEQEEEEERERRAEELMRCQRYWMDSHRWTHWQQLKATGKCFCQAVDFIPAWRTPVQMPMSTYPNEQHNAGASDHDNN